MAVPPLPNDILRAWQRIEFFQPYTIEKKDNSLLIPINKLQQAGDNALPWLSSELRQQYEIPKNASFTLHLGLFEKSIASTISQDVFGAPEGFDAEESEQRLNQEGTTCFAKLFLNAEGTPKLDKLSVSSLPWALGHLREQRFQQLESPIFSADCNHLANTLTNFRATLKPLRENSPVVLRAEDIVTLLTYLVQWADFQPRWQYALQIDWFAGKGERSDTQSGEEDEGEEEINDNDKALALPILNSFFFEDIEKAITSLQQNKKCKTLKRYLSSEQNRKPGLYSQDGLRSIIDQLHPMKMPQGRWPSEPEHAMSLMQQFAINTAVEELNESRIVSVNGPPGTGKTTLLRDLVAHNIVERAKVLSGYECVAETLDSAGFIVQPLTGFEMVVASSNNAAVENISKELPQLKSLAEEFKYLDYLAPTANQIAAERRPKRDNKRAENGEGKVRDYHLFLPLEEQKQCWGIISAALGKKANREQFAQRLLINEHFLRKTPAEDSRPANENFLSLWRWRNKHNATSFAAAKKNFSECLKQTAALQDDLNTFAQLLDKKTNDSLDILSRALAQTDALRIEVNEKFEYSIAERNVVDQQIQHATQQQRLIENNAPGWLTRLINRKQVQAHKAALNSVQRHRLTLTESLIFQEQTIAEQRKQLNDINAKKRELQQNIEELNQQQAYDTLVLERLHQKFPHIALPDTGKLINDEALQRTALWQNPDINRQRSKLFIAAMELHQAWLYEALGIDRFRGNIRNLGRFLSHPHNETTPLRWWQTLSLIVPVLSTTFASVGRMFHGVKGEELGWLMIDEAGQASPQQAVGAIWRARRVLVVGDPLQIEPVFTTSPMLVDRICQNALHQDADKWNPGKFSVQQLADRVNHWGCNLDVMGQPVWIGIPLWVHRRCIEPMFSMANKMAYNNRMIHGLPTEKICSRWVNENIENHWLASAGGQGEKQYRTSHGNHLLQLLDRLLAENVALHSIYIITPFKAVKLALLELLQQRNLNVWRQYSPFIKRKDIDEWQRQCVGTVHTFQGKENDIVIFVLGCDEHDDGGAKWASSKPNLLNVAVTRAKKNFFVIGDPGVWQSLPWFEDVAKRLPVIISAETGNRRGETAADMYS